MINGKINTLADKFASAGSAPLRQFIDAFKFIKAEADGDGFLFILLWDKISHCGHLLGKCTRIVSPLIGAVCGGGFDAGKDAVKEYQSEYGSGFSLQHILQVKYT